MDTHDTLLPRCRAAIARLQRALERLENVAVAQKGDLFLADELRRARDDYARLDEASRLVEARLDGVIGRLKIILEDEPQ